MLALVWIHHEARLAMFCACWQERSTVRVAATVAAQADRCGTHAGVALVASRGDIVGGLGVIGVEEAVDGGLPE